MPLLLANSPAEVVLLPLFLCVGVSLVFFVFRFWNEGLDLFISVLDMMMMNERVVGVFKLHRDRTTFSGLEQIVPEAEVGADKLRHESTRRRGDGSRSRSKGETVNYSA